MEKYLASSIGVNDLVIVEARLTRWKCDEKGNTAYRGTWDRYRVGFELGAVSLLFVGPETAPPDLLDDVDEEDDAF